MAVLVYTLLTFRRWNDEVRHMRGFLVTFAVLLLELGIENFFIFVSLLTHPFVVSYHNSWLRLALSVAYICRLL